MTLFDSFTSVCRSCWDIGSLVVLNHSINSQGSIEERDRGSCRHKHFLALTRRTWGVSRHGLDMLTTNRLEDWELVFNG